MANRGALVLDVFSIIFACAIVQFGIWQVTGESVFFLQFWYIHQFAPPLWLIGYTVAALAVIVLVIFCNPIKAKRGEYGYAAWATPVDVRNMRDKGKRGDKGLFSDSGLILGKAWGRYLKMDQPLSVALFAPPGTGKTAGFVIPNLFSCGNSKIVLIPRVSYTIRPAKIILKTSSTSAPRLAMHILHRGGNRCPCHPLQMHHTVDRLLGKPLNLLHIALHAR